MSLFFKHNAQLYKVLKSSFSGTQQTLNIIRSNKHTKEEFAIFVNRILTFHACLQKLNVSD